MLHRARGDQPCGLDESIKHCASAQDQITGTLDDLTWVTETICTYISHVLGFPALDLTSARRFHTDLETHLFQGHRKNTAIAGYHHRAGGIDHGELKTTPAGDTDGNGVYRGSVEAPGQDASKDNSTFFPDEWTRDEVRAAVAAAFANRQPVLNAKGLPRLSKWEGTTPHGVRIRGFVTPGTDLATATINDLATAYPVHQTPLQRKKR